MSVDVTIFDPLEGHRGSRRFEREPVTIGRDPGCDLQVPMGFVSSRHAEIRRDPERGVVLVDLGSTNGTHHHGRSLAPHRPLVIGSRAVVTIGRIELTIEDVPATPSRPRDPAGELAEAHALLRRLQPLYAAWAAAEEDARRAEEAGLAALSPAARELALLMIERDLPRYRR